ncbi:glucose-6-phosphate isomerase family protein [Fusobacterium sp.]|uniref:glucose-6-phosphate isomerase family protein n=1 Tax=Fusobacterium sp. TaxID=68766 RepID=UPI0025BA7B99|nr:glucose-6-phosphate isomerase family protein [Fusobacterium sp.]
MEILEPKYCYNFYDGILKGENVQHYKKYYEDIEFAYKSKDVTLSKKTLMYEVFSINKEEDNTLFFGLTLMYPILVNGECNLIRGHYHIDKNEPEIYFGYEGEGLLLLIKDNEIFAEKVYEGSIHYINGQYAHRLINIGSTIFKVGACWKEKAGHNYEEIERFPFPVRIFKNGNNIEIKIND